MSSIPRDSADSQKYTTQVVAKEIETVEKCTEMALKRAEEAHQTVTPVAAKDPGLARMEILHRWKVPE